MDTRSDSVGFLDECLSKAPLPKDRQSSTYAAASMEVRSLRANNCAIYASRMPIFSMRADPDQYSSSDYASARNVPTWSSSCWGEQCNVPNYDEVRCDSLHSVAGPRSVAQPICRVPSRGVASPTRFIDTGSSLPAMATQGASLASLCTVLSSPASHMTLATAKSRCSFGEPKVSAEDNTTVTEAAAAAFGRSMTWAPESAKSEVSSGLLPSISVSQNDRTALSFFGQPETTVALPPISVADTLRADMVCTVTALPPWQRVPTGKTATCASDSSEKRGLSEETVRGGSPRNTWRYCGVAVANMRRAL
ncbi:hypothetical protein VaNZ11_002917 [Volvox africanus]|uniref:Ig-like domain-containing protein n=1 Tax=Volvox africanus TaxID=51714 RepID=A0ABQ5RT85_9CHLO|nr:hypothetical protein VaNZ11_002917 [Volvox africanus]